MLTDMIHFYFLVYQMEASCGSETTATSISIKTINFVNWDAASWRRMKNRCHFADVLLWNEISQESVDDFFTIS